MRQHPVFPDEAAVDSIGRRFAARTLPHAEWTHAGHFAAAVWMLARHPVPPPERVMPDMIRAYNLAVGTPNTDTGGYHETITQASLRAARAALAAAPGAGLHLVCNRLLAGPCGDPDWLLAYWSRAALFSVRARSAWLPPDRAALPF